MISPIPIGKSATVTNCKICNSRNRRHVDMLLTTGWSQSETLRWLNETEKGETKYSPKNIHTHFRKHLEIQDRAIAHIIEERAKASGMDIEGVSGLIMTREATAQIIAQRGIEGIVQGTTAVKTEDVLKALEYLDNLEQLGREQATDEIMRDYVAFSNAVQELLREVAQVIGRPYEELMTEVGRKYERNLEANNPVLELSPARIVEEE